MEIAESFAFVESVAIALVWDTPIVAKTSAKKTYKWLPIYVKSPHDSTGCSHDCRDQEWTKA
jgi:hypothetical protein